MGRARSPPYILSYARMNERSGGEREREKRAGGKKREAKERASLEILEYPEGMQMFGVHLEVCGREGGRGRAMAVCKSCIIQCL